MMPSGTLVLLYHRVCMLNRDPYGFAVRPDHFAEHCDVLRKRRDVVPLVETNGTRRQIVITFDDGYADNSGEACRILTAAGLPATFFVAAGRIGERTEVWWDRLEQIVLGSEPVVDYIDVDIDGKRLWADVRSAMARERTLLALQWRLRRLRPSAIDPVLTRLAAQLGGRPGDRETRRWMTREELRSLAMSPGVHVGSHTVTHPFLTALSADEQWTEIDGSRQQLEEILNAPVQLFSYPYGGPDAFDQATTDMLRRSGYRLACTGVAGLARPNNYPLSICRNVVADSDGGAFERWLSRWDHP